MTGGKLRSVSDWIGNAVTCNAFGVFVGALLGALVGHGATVYYDHRETAADGGAAAVLFRALRNQLARWHPEPTLYVRGMHNQLKPVEVSVIGPLSHGTVRDARHDAALLEKLLEIESAIRVLNELVTVYNQTFLLAGLYVDDSRLTEERENWYLTGADYDRQFIQLRDDVLGPLPPDDQR